MSKELTEQWRNGTLKRGYYYYLTKVGARVMGFQCYGLKYPYDYNHNTIDSVKEVLAPVPDYDQFSQTAKKVEELESRLKEAENIIQLYFKNTQTATHQSLGMNDGYYKKAYMHTVAKEYLEKCGVE